ncbi:hypothetical protein J4772_29700 [Cohnella sp. LGH]|uniref:hypothetical protein n=1 Tax=Cohnella sp. LGH TaxID=1619153 RepID=UPI001ADB82F7|nr:hypothetical protein [Cohnella sp. LGH]QTH41664.1 hypothetical protein J4772_29700 [Cohnella sp. LGH]
MGTPKVEYLLDMEDEYFRRFKLERIMPFEECDERFCKLLNDIETAIQPPRRIQLGALESGLPQLLHEYCQGRIGYLHAILIEAYRLLGVFADDFRDISAAELTVTKLREAKESFFGQTLRV